MTTEALFWLAVAFAALSAGGLVWLAVANIKVKSGWQTGNGPIARWLDARRRAKFNATAACAPRPRCWIKSCPGATATPTRETLAAC